MVRFGYGPNAVTVAQVDNILLEDSVKATKQTLERAVGRYRDITQGAYIKNMCVKLLHNLCLL